MNKIYFFPLAKPPNSFTGYIFPNRQCTWPPSPCLPSVTAAHPRQTQLHWLEPFLPDDMSLQRWGMAEDGIIGSHFSMQPTLLPRKRTSICSQLKANICCYKKKGFFIFRQTHLPASPVPTTTPSAFGKPEQIQPSLIFSCVGFVY